MSNTTFNNRLLPDNVEELRMQTLIVLIGNTVVKLLAQLDKKGVPLSSPIAVQIMNMGNDVRRTLEKNLNATGKEALNVFFSAVNRRFQNTAPNFNLLIKKYGLKADKITGNVVVEDTEIIDEATGKVGESGFVKNPKPRKVGQYETYHPLFSGAASEALEYLVGRGYKVDDDDWMRLVSMGPAKPREDGMHNTYSIPLQELKNGEWVQARKHGQITITRLSKNFELVVYIA